MLLSAVKAKGIIRSFCRGCLVFWVKCRKNNTESERVDEVIKLEAFGT